jgi:type VI secretion system secreted protein VgrG
MPLSQKNRSLGLKSPLGEDVLLLTALHGREELSRLFTYQLEMISDNNAIAAKEIVGKPVTFNVKMPDGSPRHFHGIVSRFSAGDEDDNKRRDYRAEVVPWLWFLTLTTDCRIFQNKKVPEIIEQIFQDLGFTDFDTSQIKGAHPKRDYCVQYRETDFNFVSRLMEEEGIFYFFKHEDGKHTLVLADHKGAYKDCPEKEVDYPRDFGSRAIDDYITSWEHHWEFRTGRVAQTDYNFETPSTKLLTMEKTVVPLPGMDKFEMYDFPGGYGTTGDGQPLAKTRMEESEAGHDVVQGSSFCKSFTPGGKFKIKQHRSSGEVGKSYMITSISHSATETAAYETGVEVEFDYKNTFTCIPDSVSFRPARITEEPFVEGPQTAVVVGPAGEEIYTDKHGRVKVQFFWDREGKKDENSSCWMRVSQVHAGKSFGGIDIPRIGEEVIVSFLEGDPDLPIITGRVYHAENMPPFGLPAAKVISGMKSNSTKGGGGYNEYILDDTKGKELIREHGQFDKDSTIEHDLREHVLNNRSRDVTVDEDITIGSNQKYSIGANQTGSVGADKKLTIGANHTESIGSSMTINIGTMLSETVGINYSETVGAAMELTVGAFMSQTIGAVYTLSVGASMSETIGSNKTTKIGANRKEQVGANVTEKVGGNVSQQVSGKHTEKVSGNYLLKAANITLNAKSEITLKTGSASITMKKSGEITIKGTKIKIEGSAKIEEKSANISSEASAKNVVKGAMVNVEASAINTIKGSLVKIN